MAKQKEAEIFETLFSSDFAFKGSIHSEEVVLVQGKIEGSIDSSVEIYVSKRACIEADITAKNVITYGTIRGAVRAKDAVEIYESAEITGDIEANKVAIEKGALLNGRYKVGEKKIP